MGNIWEIDGQFAKLTLNKKILESEEAGLSREAQAYFDLGRGAGKDHQIYFYYEGSEYPAFCEGGRSPKVTWSKALTLRLRNAFPFLDSLFEEEARDRQPVMLFDKRNTAEYLIFLELPSNKHNRTKEDLFTHLDLGEISGQKKELGDIVFFRELFDNLDNFGCADVLKVADRLEKYLEDFPELVEGFAEGGDREGLVLALLDHEYTKHIEGKFMSIMNVEGHLFFQINPTVFSGLSKSECSKIVECMDKRLIHYIKEREEKRRMEAASAEVEESARGEEEPRAISELRAIKALAENGNSVGAMMALDEVLGKSESFGQGPQSLRRGRANSQRINIHDFTRRPEQVEYTVPEDTAKAIERLKDDIEMRGYSPAENLVECLYLSLKTYPIIALAGTSGSGRDRLVRIFAESLGATFENGHFIQARLKNVKNIKERMFGSYNPYNNVFTEGELTEFILHAIEEPEAPFFIYLKDLPLNTQDDFLGELVAIYDTRRWNGDDIITDPILRLEHFGLDEAAVFRYNGLYLPDNLFIIAGISKEKYEDQDIALLDHVGVINVSVKSLGMEEDIQPGESVLYGSDFLKSEFLSLSENRANRALVRNTIERLEEINKVLELNSAQIGPKERDEICLFLLYNSDHKLIAEDAAFDLALAQRVLPRVHGVNDRTGDLLDGLYAFCLHSNKAGSYAQEGREAYPLTVRKIQKMKKAFERGKTASVLV